MGLSPQGNWGSLDLRTCWGYHSQGVRVSTYTGAQHHWAASGAQRKVSNLSLTMPHHPSEYGTVWLTFLLRTQDAVNLVAVAGGSSRTGTVHYQWKNAGLGMWGFLGTIRLSPTPFLLPLLTVQDSFYIPKIREHESLAPCCTAVVQMARPQQLNLGGNRQWWKSWNSFPKQLEYYVQPCQRLETFPYSCHEKKSTS